MFSDMSRDPEFIDIYIVNVILSFDFISACVQKTGYDYRLHQVELQLINRLAIKHFSTVCKDSTGYALRCTVMTIYKVIGFGMKEEIQFYFQNRVFKMLASAFVSFLSSKDCIDYAKLNDLSVCLIALSKTAQFKNSISLKDVRVLTSNLIDLVDSKKHTTAPPQFLGNRLRLASKIIIASSLLTEKHFVQLKDSNILSLLVETIKTFDTKNQDAVSFSLSMLMYCVFPDHLPMSLQQISCWLTLREIDQVLPAISFCIKLLCSVIVSNLLRIKEDRTSYIKCQLDALRQYNFVSSICEALIHNEDSSITFQLLDILRKSNNLFDNREFIGNLVELLPKLAEKQHRYLENGNFSKERAFFVKESCSIMRKAAAYVLDQLQPTFVEDVVAEQVVSGWMGFRISGGKLFFSSDVFGTEEKFGEGKFHEERLVDVLRATWWLNRKCPHIIIYQLPLANPLFPPESSDITKLTSTTIIKTIISYLDHSQDKSLRFLTELTTLVKDLAHDSVSSEENKLLFEDLVTACERFMMVNTSKTFSENLQHFIDVNRGVVTADGLLLD